MSKKIVFDVDGVLADFVEAFGVEGRKLYGRDRVPRGFVPDDWNFSGLFSKEEMDQLWGQIKRTPNWWEGLQPVSENTTAVQELLNHFNNDVWFLTSRVVTTGRSIPKQTQNWLADQGIRNHQGVMVVSKADYKRQILEGLSIDAMIDDYGPTIEAAQTIPGFKAYLLDRPWNKDAKVEHRVNNVGEFLEEILN